MLKEIHKKLKSLAPSYECEKSDSYHQPSFVGNVKFEYKLKNHKQYGFKPFANKEV